MITYLHLTCHQCKEPFSVQLMGNTNRRFCSRDCYWASMRTSPIVLCTQCGCPTISHPSKPRKTCPQCSRPFATFSVEEQFWHLVQKSDGCWLWQGHREPFGYGIIYEKRDSIRNGKRWKAHRLSWTIHYGDIPERVHVLHKCDNPPCVRPDHLFLGTQQDNMTDMCQKGRHKCNFPKGFDHYHSKLTEEQIRYIRTSDISKRGTIVRLARECNVSHVTIRNVLNRKVYSFIND